MGGLRPVATDKGDDENKPVQANPVSAGTKVKWRRGLFAIP